MNRRTDDFLKALSSLKRSKSPYEVFGDWLVLAAASLYAPWKKDEAVEKEYLETAKQYKKEELEIHGELLAITVTALEEKEQDFLGEVFTHGRFTNNKKGQFFTPYNVSYMGARMIVDEHEFPLSRVCKINDCCCGAGGMLVAAAAAMRERGLNYQHDALFIGADIDARCARMAFIQLSLLGVPAVIYCGDSLARDIYWHRETIGYHLADMEFRLRAERMLDIIRDGPAAEPPEEKPKAEIKLPQGRLVQGELFEEEV